VEPPGKQIPDAYCLGVDKIHLPLSQQDQIHMNQVWILQLTRQLPGQHRGELLALADFNDPFGGGSADIFSPASTPVTSLLADEIVKELMEMTNTGRSSLHRKDTTRPQEEWAPFAFENACILSSGSSGRKTPTSGNGSGAVRCGAVHQYVYQPAYPSRRETPTSTRPTSYRSRYYQAEPEAPTASRNPTPTRPTMTVSRREAVTMAPPSRHSSSRNNHSNEGSRGSSSSGYGHTDAMTSPRH